MITTTMMYFIIKLDSIINFFDIIFNVSIGFIAVCIIPIGISVMAIEGEGNEADAEMIAFRRKGWSACKKFIATLIACSFITSFIPTTKEMAAIYVIPKVANSQFVNETFPNELKDIYMTSKDWMKDFLKSKEKDIEKVIEKKTSEVLTNEVPSVTIKIGK